MDFQQMQTIFEDSSLRVRYSPGRTNTLFVSFTGVGHGLGGILPDEFIGTTQRHHALFVSDLTRSWYNHGTIYEDVLEICSRVKNQVRANQVITIGNSMGGFGSLLFAPPLRAKAAIAFAPQYSVHPDVVPDEKRWADLRDNIRSWRFRNPGELTKTPGIVFFGNHPEEKRHSAFFPARGRLSVFELEGGHDVGLIIKQHGLLEKICRHVVQLPLWLARRSISGSLWRAGLLTNAKIL